MLYRAVDVTGALRIEPHGAGRQARVSIALPEDVAHLLSDREGRIGVVLGERELQDLESAAREAAE